MDKRMLKIQAAIVAVEDSGLPVTHLETIRALSGLALCAHDEPLPSIDEYEMARSQMSKFTRLVAKVAAARSCRCHFGIDPEENKLCAPDGPMHIRPIFIQKNPEHDPNPIWNWMLLCDNHAETADAIIERFHRLGDRSP